MDGSGPCCTSGTFGTEMAIFSDFLYNRESFLWPPLHFNGRPNRPSFRRALSPAVWKSCQRSIRPAWRGVLEKTYEGTLHVGRTDDTRDPDGFCPRPWHGRPGSKLGVQLLQRGVGRLAGPCDLTGPEAHRDDPVDPAKEVNERRRQPPGQRHGPAARSDDAEMRAASGFG